MDGLTQIKDDGGRAAVPFPRWYAIHTRARHEKRIDQSLRQAGVDAFLPVIKEVHHWSDRRKEVALPLFPCYMFVNMTSDPAARLRVLQTPGVLHFVGKSDDASAIPDQEIEQVRTVIRERAQIFPCPFLNQGQRVRIRGGVLDGMEGTFSVRKRVPLLWSFRWN